MQFELVRNELTLTDQKPPSKVFINGCNKIFHSIVPVMCGDFTGFNHHHSSLKLLKSITQSFKKLLLISLKIRQDNSVRYADNAL